MKLFSADQFTFPLPQEHRFPAAKYRVLRQRVEESGLFRPEDLIVPHAATDEELLRVHTPEYLRKLREGTLSEKETSSLDIGLPDGTADARYLEAVEQGTWEALHRARAELAIYLAGADPFEGDRLGRMKVTKAGLARRNDIVFEACASERLPVAVTMAGGYGYDIGQTVAVYFQTVQQALAWWRRWPR
jgi:acetoin utilization deacetylase AcuC-like enzyme